MASVKPRAGTIRRHRWAGRLSLTMAVGMTVAPMACREESASNRPAASQEAKPRSAATAASKPAAGPAEGMDGLDSPLTPACLPKSGQIGPWVKYDAVRVDTTPRQWLRAFPTREALRLAFFQIKWVATCAYVLRTSSGGQKVAKVQLVELDSAEDAYGMMSCRCESGERFKIGGETRVERIGGLHMHGWQGRHYLYVGTTDPDDETTEEMIRLAMYVVGKLPGEPRPAILDTMPPAKTGKVRVFLVRHPASVPGGALSYVPAEDWAATYEAMAVGRNTVMCIGIYRDPQAHRPNVVWVARYPSARAAREVHDRYSRLIGQTGDLLTRSTNLLPPHGAYLVGTWTAEEESLQYVLPEIKKRLPG